MNSNKYITKDWTFFPTQKLPSNKKGGKWVKDVVRSIEHQVLKSEEIRESYYNKVTNYDLANDILNPKDIQEIFNPLGFESGKIPAAIQNYNISMSKINLLVGEEWNRKYDYRLVALNEDSHSEKEKKAKELLIQLATEELQNSDFSEEKVKQRIKELDKYIKYEYKDFRELIGTRILNHLWKTEEIKFKINNGILDALLVAEELYRTDIVAGNPKVTKVDPKKLFTIRNGDSPYLEDAEIISEVEYLPIGAVIDEFYDELTPTQIKKLEMGDISSDSYEGAVNTVADSPQALFTSTEFFDTDESSKFIFGGYFNRFGEIRVLRCRWKSFLKRYKKIYFDKFGEEQKDIVSEYYKLTPEEKMNGVTLKEFWITEWWEAIKIADDIIVKAGPRPVQFRDMNNPSLSSSGYVGTYYNINTNSAKSLMDRMKPFQYLYNIGMRRLELALAKWKAPVMQLNQTLKPDDWDTDKWLYYADVLGYLLVDPFNEATEGSHKGTMAGEMNTFTNDFLNPQMGNFIQFHIQYVEYIESILSKISGVSEQREGQINNRETVGGIERSVKQSNHITEYWFRTHEHTVRRLMLTLLETAKVAYKDSKNKKVPYILDDVSTKFMKIDGEIFNESNYDLYFSDGEKDTMVYEAIKSQIQPFIQAGGSLAKAAKMLRMDSVTQIVRELERDETEKAEQAQQQQEAQLQSIKEQQTKEAEFEKYKVDLDAEIEREKIDADIAIAELKEANNTSTEPTDEFQRNIDEKKLALEEAALKMQNAFNRDKLQEDIRKNKENESIKKKSLQKHTSNKSK